MSDKPLHVRVAEALGWTDCDNKTAYPPLEYWTGSPPDTRPVLGHREEIDHYDTDWSATGPLIEKYGLMIIPVGQERLEWLACEGFGGWDSYKDEFIKEGGETPLIAACNLILALHEAGKLKDAA